MYLPNDPFILLSFVNTKLRDTYPSLEEFCDDYEINPTDLAEKLAVTGYTYVPNRNQFRS